MIRRPLKRILVEMTKQAGNSDYELAHGVADDLLVELIEVIVDYCGDYESEIKEILEQYEKVGKWYA